MRRNLKPGDPVRVTTANIMPGYRPGEKGTVLWGPIFQDSCEPYYIVAMGKEDATTSIIFGANEIERDD
jgi:hypothetical protein